MRRVRLGAAALALVACAAPASVVAPTGPTPEATASAAGPPASSADVAPAPQEFLFAGDAPGNGGLTVTSREEVILLVDARVTFHALPGTAQGQWLHGVEDPGLRAFVFGRLREAMSASSWERGVADIWGAKRAEWVAATAERCRPTLEAQGIALDRLEVVAIRISANIEAALRRSGVVPPEAP